MMHSRSARLAVALALLQLVGTAWVASASTCTLDGVAAASCSMLCTVDGLCAAGSTLLAGLGADCEYACKACCGHTKDCNLQYAAAYAVATSAITPAFLYGNLFTSNCQSSCGYNTEGSPAPGALSCNNACMACGAALAMDPTNFCHIDACDNLDPSFLGVATVCALNPSACSACTCGTKDTSATTATSAPVEVLSTDKPKKKKHHHKKGHRKGRKLFSML